MKKVLWVKFGWSEFYRGGPVDGNFPFLLDGEQGHEAWNFLRQENGLYGCYTPPQGASASTPSNIDPHGWTVICLAKKPGQIGIHIVGWYEDATLVGHYKDRPANFDPGAFRSADDLYHYSIESGSAYLVPSEYRTRPFSHPSVRTGKYSFLSGPNVELTKNKSVVLETIEREMSRLKKLSIRNPDVESAPDRENDEDDPLAGFGTPEHRKEVEGKSVAAVQSYLERNGYTWTSREKDNVGYDLEAFRESDSDELHVEVKGTSGSSERFFMTLNEHNYLEASQWRLAMVTNTLNQPNIRFYTLNEFRDAFDFGPMVWKGVKRKSE